MATYNSRATPLAVDTGSSYTSTQAIAWDLTGYDTRSVPEAFDFVGSTNPTFTLTGTISQVTRNSIPGRQPSPISLYEYTSATDYGLQVGTGDWQVGAIFSTGSSVPTTNNTLLLYQIHGDSGILVDCYIDEFASNGWYLNAGSTLGLGGSAGATFYGANKTVIFWMRRRSGIVSTWTQEAVAGSTLTRRHNDGSTESTNWNSSNAKRFRALYNSSGSATIDIACHGIKFWNGSFTDTDTQTIGRDWFALETQTGGGGGGQPPRSMNQYRRRRA